MSATTTTRRVALVTGAGRPGGIGAGIALELARAGHAIAIVDFEVPVDGGDGDVREVLDDVRAEGVPAVALAADVRRPDDCAAVVARCIEELGSCDVLINNAAAPHGDARNDVATVPPEAFEMTIDTNLGGTFLMTRAVIPVMRRAAWGRIVNLSSIGATRAVRHRAAYSASKAGIEGLTRGTAIDVADAGITVNAVCPGMIHTPRNYEAPDAPSTHRTRAKYGGAPAGRSGTPQDVAYAVAFLVSDQAAYITGQTLAIDGGLGVALTPATS